MYLFKASKRAPSGKTYRILAVTGQDPYYIVQVRWEDPDALFSWVILCEITGKENALEYWKWIMSQPKRKIRKWKIDYVPF